MSAGSGRRASWRPGPGSPRRCAAATGAACYGHIPGEGSVWLRWVLCEAAQTAKRHPDFAASFAAIAQRRGKKIATTAVARKLLTRAWHLLTDAQAVASPQPAAPPMAAR